MFLVFQAENYSSKHHTILAVRPAKEGSTCVCRFILFIPRKREAIEMPTKKDKIRRQFADILKDAKREGKHLQLSDLFRRVEEVDDPAQHE